MSSEDFKTQASARGLDEGTVTLLVDKDFQNEEGLSEMAPDQLNSLELSDTQRKALQKWLVDLYVQYKKEDNVAAMKNEETPASEITLDVSKDYEEPSAPRPSGCHRSINVAITGQVSSGRSSIINALRGHEPTHAEAVSTKVGEEHTEMMPYKYQKVENMLLWELPAVDDKSDEYLQKVEFGVFDAVIVCSAERLSEWDIWIANEAQKADIRSFIVRTKIDRDVESDKEDYGEKHDEKALLERIRKDIEGQVDKADLYLLSTKSKFWEQWDLEKLSTNLAGVTKKEASPAKVEAKVVTIENSAKKDDDADKIIEQGENKPEDTSEKGKIESLAAKFKAEIPELVKKAAKSGGLKILNAKIMEYKKKFGVEKLPLPEVNLDSLENVVDQFADVKKTGVKNMFMSCFGGRSKAAQNSENKEKVTTHITDEAPTMMENAIDRCKEAALEKLDSK